MSYPKHNVNPAEYGWTYQGGNQYRTTLRVALSTGRIMMAPKWTTIPVLVRLHRRVPPGSLPNGHVWIVPDQNRASIAKGLDAKRKWLVRLLPADSTPSVEALLCDID